MRRMPADQDVPSKSACAGTRGGARHQGSLGPGSLLDAHACDGPWCYTTQRMHLCTLPFHATTCNSLGSHGVIAQNVGLKGTKEGVVLHRQGMWEGKDDVWQVSACRAFGHYAHSLWCTQLSTEHTHPGPSAWQLCAVMQHISRNGSATSRVVLPCTTACRAVQQRHPRHDNPPRSTPSPSPGCTGHLSHTLRWCGPSSDRRSPSWCQGRRPAAPGAAAVATVCKHVSNVFAPEPQHPPSPPDCINVFTIPHLSLNYIVGISWVSRTDNLASLVVKGDRAAQKKAWQKACMDVSSERMPVAGLIGVRPPSPYTHPGRKKGH